ncbi:hypothetical protein K3495_g12584 [Podosphaera aphanis]|nr:hypothetical protein K3495_g12584 [Podosphaera aphanis]
MLVHGPLVVRSNDPFWVAVTGRVSNTAIMKVHEEYKFSESPNSEDKIKNVCRGIFTNTIGLPCRHRLKSMKSNTIPLAIKDLHRYWWFDQPPISVPQPIIQRPISNILASISRRLEKSSSDQQAVLRWALKKLTESNIILEEDSNPVRKNARPLVLDSGKTIWLNPPPLGTFSDVTRS